METQLRKCLESRDGKKGSFFQSVGIGCLWCSVEKDSKVSPGSLGGNTGI